MDEFSELYDRFLAYVDKGDEEGARNFLLENLEKFPENVQEKLTFAFFEEATAREGQEIEGMAGVQKQALAAMDQVHKSKNTIEDKIKIRDLRSKLLNGE